MMPVHIKKRIVAASVFAGMAGLVFGTSNDLAELMTFEYESNYVPASVVYNASQAESKKWVDNMLAKPTRESFKDAASVPDANWVFIDIRPFCNMGFEDKEPSDGKGGWTDAGPAYDLSPFGIDNGKEKFGVVKLYGVPFTIIDPSKNNGQAMIIMGSSLEELKGDRFPLEVSVPVHRKLSRLYILHGATWAVPTPEEYQRYYDIVYKDGRKERIRIKTGGGSENIMNWMWDPSTEANKGWPLVEMDAARPVPVMTNKGQREDLRYLYAWEFINPTPDNEIDHIEVLSARDGSKLSFGMIALTGINYRN